ncbi:hypothetical protein GCM10009564_16720 [Streptomyces thermogriseus]|uniref:Uncharacterized protein n=1 Tax=Streptomyces thermogriseus TaxID=75292 RepID=A0ABN1SX87_9ACTN
MPPWSFRGVPVVVRRGVPCSRAASSAGRSAWSLLRILPFLPRAFSVPSPRPRAAVSGTTTERAERFPDDGRAGGTVPEEACGRAVPEGAQRLHR